MNTSLRSAPEMRPTQEVRIPMEEAPPKVRRRSPRKIARPLSDSPNGSSTTSPPLPPRPKSMLDSGLNQDKTSRHDHAKNLYRPQDVQNPASNSNSKPEMLHEDQVN